MSSIFDSFTNQYSLSKTLRFELRPVGKTLENMRHHLRYDEKLQTFLADQEIEDAYLALKPIFDSLHEEFITESLESEPASKIDFTDYYRKYEEKAELKDEEKKLRSHFTKAYEETANLWKQKAGTNDKGKAILTEKSYKVLTEKGILEYIRKNADQFPEIKSAEEILAALKAFEGFFTYLGGFNQNRENYYEVSKEASTAVASRIAHDNLPKFCDNLIFFDGRREEYKNIYENLKNLEKSLVDKEGHLLIPIEEDIFRIGFYNRCLSQTGIEEYNKKVGNANFLINLYNQDKSTEENFKKLSFFKVLYKQIGCGEKKSLFFALTHSKKVDAEKARNKNIEAFSVEEVLELAHLAGKKYFEGISDDGFINTVPEFINYLSELDDFEGVYWSKMAVNTISNKYFANWHDLKDKLKKTKVFPKDKNSEDGVKIPDAVELSALFSVMDDVEENWKETFFKNSVLEDGQKKEKIAAARSPSRALMGCILLDIENHAHEFVQLSQGLLKLEDYSKNKEQIKACFDHPVDVNRMLKYFLVKESKVKGHPINSQLSHALDVLLRAEDANWFKWYDALRNFLTKKPQDDIKENKLKLNFENSTLASGWDVNKEPDNYCVLLKDPDDKYFLAIIAKEEHKKGYNKLFVKSESNSLYKVSTKNSWQKVEYKLLPGPNKMLPKCLLPKSNRFKYGATEDLLSIYDAGGFKKNEPNFSLENLHKVIDFYKDALKRYEDWRCFDFSFDETSKYQDISKFYTDVEKQGYKLDFVDIDRSVLDAMVEEGKVYLFEVKNQDSNNNKQSNHHNNLHTIYWRAIFENVENRPKLNGEAEIFYRKAVPSDKLDKIRDKNGKEIIKNYRFSRGKFLFHVPITLNFCLKNNRINDLVNKGFSRAENVCFLGIDRGEKHLAYYSLVDKDGKIIEQGTLNMPFVDKDGKSRTVKAEKRTAGKDGKEKVEIVECKDYNELLQVRAGDRDYARKNWQTIGTIKELKEGYISLVVRAIADLAVHHQAYIVMEDLNTGFKRGRQKIEHAVYQKQELALAKKLNFLVDKKVKLGEVGSVTQALQLTPPVQNYGDIENRKQVGIILYTRANYTSQTDPVTGWRKSIYLKKGSEPVIKKQLIDNFSEIDFDGRDYRFIYRDEKTGKEWILFSGKNGKSLDHFRGDRNKNTNVWEIKSVDVVQILDGVFDKFDKNRSLLSQIEEGIELTKVSEHTSWESLRFAIELIQQIRNSGNETKDNDFLHSPVRNEKGNHFDSREYLLECPLDEKGTTKAKMPINGDSNGAYNIARKGVLMSEHVKRGYGLLIRDEEWDAWLLGKDVWEKWIKENEKVLIQKNFQSARNKEA